MKPTELNGMGRGRHRRVLDILHRPDCYLLLCKYHHAVLDAILDRL